MTDDIYIDYLERVVLALLKEREESGYDHDLELEPKVDSIVTREYVSVFNLKDLIERKRR